MQGIMEALNFHPWTFLWQVVNLLFVIGVLYIFLYKPLGKLLADREARIEGNINKAAEARENAEKLLSDYQKQLQDARREAQDIIERATKLGEETRMEIVNKAKEEANRVMEQTRAEIEAEKAKALADIRNEAANLAVLAAGKILERTLTEDDQVRLAKEAVAEVERLQ